MNELELLLLRLEDLQESASNNEVRLLAKALNRYFQSEDKTELGFSGKGK